MADPDPIDDLIQTHLAGRLDDEGAARLRAWLAGGRAQRERFMRAVRFHAELGELATELARRRAGEASAGRTGVGRSARRRAVARPRIRHPLAWSAALAAALLVAVLWSWPTRRPAEAVLRLATGSARTAEGRPVAAGEAVAPGSALVMVDDGGLRWRDGSEVALAAGAAVVCGEAGLALGSGRCEAMVMPRPADQPFVITTAQATVTVIGTRFSVEAAAAQTRVAVTAGRVRVADRAGDARELGVGDALAIAASGWGTRTLAVAPAAGPGARTLAAALADAQPGDTVLLLPGRHGAGAGGTHPTVHITRGGSAGSPLVLRGEPGAELVSDEWNAIHVADTAWVELRGLRLRYQGTARSGGAGNGILIERSRHITVADCHVSGFGGDGIVSNGGDHLLIEGNRVEDCGGGYLGVQGGITIGMPEATDAAPGHHIRVLRNRVLRSTLNFPNHRDPARWTGGQGILLHSRPTAPYAPRILVTGNLVAASGGAGIAVYQLGNVDLRGNLVHGSGRQPAHGGGEIQCYAPGCVASGNLLVPAPGRRAWVLRAQDPLVREGNRVWEADGVPRAEVDAAERAPSSPFLHAVADELQRSDFRLRPGVVAGPPGDL